MNPERRLLFISHANPEDNAAAAWFATQLSLLGYEVWCDLKNTHGGESDFWLKVQRKIEEEAAKFIFLLTNTSRDFQLKKGVYKEVQAADNTGRENFIVPLRLEKLTGSVPIIVGTDVYINSESWAAGLAELHNRLVEDQVPKAAAPIHERILSWWPALRVREKLLLTGPSELVSNVVRFTALPKSIHLLRVRADGNPLKGYEPLRHVFPIHPAHSAQNDYAVSFACADDFANLAPTYEVGEGVVIPTTTFLAEGSEEAGISSQTARNVTTYLVAAAVEHFLAGRGLRHKELSHSSRRIWYPASGLLTNDRHSTAEAGGRKTPKSLVGKVSYRSKTYTWHFGVQPAVDLHMHHGLLLSPKAILTGPYRPDLGQRPIPIRHRKAEKQLRWWNGEWRAKTLAFLGWLADDREEIRIPVGYQEIVLAAAPTVFASAQSYVDKGDSELIEEILGDDA